MGGDGVALGALIGALDDERKETDETAKAEAAVAALAARPGHQADIEEVVIGAALLAPDDVLGEIEDLDLAPSDFTVRPYALIWTAILDLWRQKIHVDTTAVADALLAREVLDEVGGHEAVSDVAIRGVASATAAAASARRLIEWTRRRELIRVCGEAHHRCTVGHPSAEIIEAVEQAISALDRGRGIREAADLPTLARAAVAALPGMGGQIIGLGTGFPEIDRYLRLRPGSLTLLAARPSMGKTQLALDIAAFHALAGRRVAFWSLEQPDIEIVTRLIAAKCGVPPRKMHFNPAEATALQAGAADVAESTLLLYDRAGLTTGEIRTACRRAHRQEPLALIVIDYFTLIRPARRTGNGNYDYGLVSLAIKELARELNVAVLLLSQLNRAVESRSDRRPVMSDLRETGSLEQDADAIAFLFREEYYLKEKTPEKLRGVVEAIIAKNRHGPVGSATLRFEKEIPRFTSAPRSGGSWGETTIDSQI